MGYDDGDGEPLDGSKRGPRVWSAFRPILRIYEPEDAVFDGGYEPPPITAA